jgi:hypothetical protein
MRPKSSLRRRSGAALTIIACAIGASSLSAHAQTALSVDAIKHAIEASGYEVTGPIVRRGATYVVDVVGEGDVSEQFIIDAHDGRLLKRYRGQSGVRRQAVNPNPQSALTNFFDGLFGGADDVAPLPPPPDDDFFDKPRPKPHVRRPPAAPAPIAQQAKAPNPSGAVPAANPASAPTPAPAAAPAPINPPPKAASPKPNDVQVAPLE